MSKDYNPNPGSYDTIRYTFQEALTYLKAAKFASGLTRLKIQKRGKKAMKLIKGWAKKGNVNVVYYLHILQAQFAFLVGKKRKAEESF